MLIHNPPRLSRSPAGEAAAKVDSRGVPVRTDRGWKTERYLWGEQL